MTERKLRQLNIAADEARQSACHVTTELAAILGALDETPPATWDAKAYAEQGGRAMVDLNKRWRAMRRMLRAIKDDE